MRNLRGFQGQTLYLMYQWVEDNEFQEDRGM